MGFRSITCGRHSMEARLDKQRSINEMPNRIQAMLQRSQKLSWSFSLSRIWAKRSDGCALTKFSHYMWITLRKEAWPWAKCLSAVRKIPKVGKLWSLSSRNLPLIGDLSGTSLDRHKQKWKMSIILQDSHLKQEPIWRVKQVDVKACFKAIVIKWRLFHIKIDKLLKLKSRNQPTHVKTLMTKLTLCCILWKYIFSKNGVAPIK
jgi:hypothetical protein